MNPSTETKAGSATMAPVTDRLAEMAAHLRTLRSCFGNTDTPSTPGAWSAAAYAYDEALVLAAHSLQVRGAPEPFMVQGRRRLTEPERAQLEEALAAMGVDVGVVRYLPRTDRALLALPSGRPTAAPERPREERREERPPAPRPAAAQRRDTATRRRPEPALTRRPVGTGGNIGRVAEEARRLRRRLAAYRKTEKTWPTKVAEWTADLDAYDDVILTLGEMVGVPSPLVPGAQRRLLFEDRVRFEQQLTEAGVDLIGA